MSAERAGNIRSTYPTDEADRSIRLQRRIEREHAARNEAERLLETKSLELFAANQRLIHLNTDLERRVQARTRQVEDAREAAIKIGSTDYLTGISNRFDYSNQLERSLGQTLASGGATGLLLVDLDSFKLVNDTYGHDHGDQLLVTIAERLKTIANGRAVVARIGGDEFAIILEGSDAGSIFETASRFGDIFTDPITIHGVTIQCSGSLGLAVCPNHANNAADLQRFADLALYRCKKSGGKAMAVFETGLLEEYEFRQRMEAEFRNAAEGGGIDLVYQPIVNLHSGTIDAVEALARWSDSNGQVINPAYFIQMAEQCGIIRGVGRSLLEKALLEAKRWVDSASIKRVSFNVSPLELLDEGFSSAVLNLLDKVQFDPRRLLLEITEGAIIRNVALAERVIRTLNAQGVMFALDDFGCGYSNLSTLRKLSISVLKIDRSLLADCISDRAARTIIRNVVSLCRELGICSVCEGAESAAQIDFLRAIRCDLVQGFAAGRPLPAHEFEALLESARRGPAQANSFDPGASAEEKIAATVRGR